MRAYSNEEGNKDGAERMHTGVPWFLEKTSKIDKALAVLIKKKNDPPKCKN